MMADHPTSPGAGAYVVVRSDRRGGGHISHGPWPTYQEAQDWACAHSDWNVDKPPAGLDGFAYWMTIPLNKPT